jgi:hypothetical protein
METALMKNITTVSFIKDVVFQTNLSEKKRVAKKKSDPHIKVNKIKRCNCFVKVKLRS